MPAAAPASCEAGSASGRPACARTSPARGDVSPGGGGRQGRLGTPRAVVGASIVDAVAVRRRV
eukprot:37268-Alexandrium_andersonii.AAC.1